MKEIVTAALSCLLFWPISSSAQTDDSDLSYTAYIDSGKRIKCLYGYAADKTGDHTAAIRIFEDCIARWSDVYSMIWLAQIYESGVGVEQDLRKATALLKRAAHSEETSGYASLARYHYGVALAEGRGVERNRDEARRWLTRASEEGVREAADYMRVMCATC